MEQAKRNNTGKPRWSLVDFKSLEPLVRSLEEGEKEYGTENWKKGFPRHKLMESLLRHAFALLDGEEIDPKSGVHHIGHIMANAMFYSYSLREKKVPHDNKESLQQY